MNATKDELQKAFNLGKAAAEAGMSCIPAHCKELMQMLDGEPVGGKGVPLMRAFNDGVYSIPMTV